MTHSLEQVAANQAETISAFLVTAMGAVWNLQYQVGEENREKFAHSALAPIQFRAPPDAIAELICDPLRDLGFEVYQITSDDEILAGALPAGALFLLPGQYAGWILDQIAGQVAQAREQLPHLIAPPLDQASENV